MQKSTVLRWSALVRGERRQRVSYTSSLDLHCSIAPAETRPRRRRTKHDCDGEPTDGFQHQPIAPVSFILGLLVEGSPTPAGR